MKSKKNTKKYIEYLFHTTLKMTSINFPICLITTILLNLLINSSNYCNALDRGGEEIINSQTHHSTNSYTRTSSSTTVISRNILSSSSCQKYILLTTQRSGSTWTCNLLDLQNGVTCGGLAIIEGVGRRPELLVKYSLMGKKNRENVQWSEYEKDLSNALHNATIADLCGDMNEIGDKSILSHSSSSKKMNSIAAGFKLMYDQIPSKFITNGQFQKYLVNHNIAVIHLIREAKILRLASIQNTKEQLKKLNGTPHTINETLANELRHTDLIQWDETLIEKLKDEEDYDSSWKKLMIFTPHLKYYQMNYEKMLLVDDLRNELRQVLSFLFENRIEKNDDWVELTTSFNLHSKLLQLHETTCSGRVSNYDEFQKRVAGTRTGAACTMLDDIFAEGENVPI